MLACASTLLTGDPTEERLQTSLGELVAQLGGQADLLVAFASPHRANELERLATSPLAFGCARHLLATTGEAIAGPEREIENDPALTLWAVRLPDGATARPIRIESGIEPVPGADPLAPQEPRALLLLGDPFTFAADAWLKHWNAVRPGMPVLGGMASAGRRPGSNRLALDDSVYADGAVGIALEGPIGIRAVVSQGCRPIGRTFLITRAERNVIRELGRRPTLEVLEELFSALDDDEQALMRKGIHIGRVINEYQEAFGRGDFLVRNVLGATEDGGIGISELVRVGQTVQFHVRDADTAHQDLEELLRAGTGAGKPVGALLFTCNGRGTRLFPQPDHDVSTIRNVCGEIPLAGFFAMGEFGPIGGQNFVHGFTASVAIFEAT